MFNSVQYDNSHADGFSVLEIVTDLGRRNPERRFVPLKSTHLTGSVSGPLSDLELTQIFGYTSAQCSKTLEAVYRFPLPGDAAVMGVTIHFGSETVFAVLKERQTAEAEYLEAQRQGKQAALTTRESPDVFTLSVTGIRPDEDIRVVTKFVMMNVSEGPNWKLRIPLTTAPRYVRSDEIGTRQSHAQPLMTLRDPGHRFGFKLRILDASDVHSDSHSIVVRQSAEETEVHLKDDETIPNRDFLLSWRSAAENEHPVMHILLHKEVPKREETSSPAGTRSAAEEIYFLAMATPPAASNAPTVPREIVLLLDRSGSMSGKKWAAADEAAHRILADLNSEDLFSIGLFHTTTRWFSRSPISATQDNLTKARRFLKHRDSGGTELGVAMEQALRMPRDPSERARHLLIITDAQVTDEGRLRYMVKQEAKGKLPRRISIVCIDTAPNAHLVNELVSTGNGIAKFLTSDPSELSLTTAMGSITADFRAPLMSNVALEINRPELEVFGQPAIKLPDGSGSSVIIGDLVTGRTRWICGRVPAGESLDLAFRLRSSSGQVIAARRHNLADPIEPCPALKAFFSARRLSALEYLLSAGLRLEDLPERLIELGLRTDSGRPSNLESVYPENNIELLRKTVKSMLVSESLACGLACSETAFIAVRQNADGTADGLIDATIPVANALPEGWVHDSGRSRMAFHYSSPGSDPCARQCSLAEYAPMELSDLLPPTSGPSMMRSSSPRVYNLGSVDSTRSDIGEIVAQYGASGNGAPANAGAAKQGSGGWFRKLTDRLRGRTPKTAAVSSPETVAVSIFCGVPAFNDQHAILFDSDRALDSAALPGDFKITALELTVFQQDLRPESLHPALSLRIFFDGSQNPTAVISIANLMRQNGMMLVNLIRPAGERIVVEIFDPCGTWETAAPIVDVRFKVH